MITIAPVALVRNTIEDFDFSEWKDVYSEIKILKPFDYRYLEYLQDEKMLQVLFHFHRSGRYRLNKDPMDVFAHRDSPRPNNLGSSIVSLKSVSDDTLVVQGLEAINGTPVVDIKPFRKEELP